MLSRVSGRSLGGILVAALAAGIAIAGTGGPGDAYALALIVLAIGLWASAAIPEHVTALLFFALATLFAVAPASTTFAGFHAAATWLIFGGLVVGVAVNVTGLGARIAKRLGGLFGHSYAGIVFGMISVGVALAFVMPSSMGRVMLLMPIALALAKRLGFAEGSNGRTAVVLATISGAFLIPFAILPANVPNVVLMGVSEDLHDYVPTYGHWLLLHFPVLGVVKALAVGGLILLLFPDRVPAQAAEDVPAAATPLTADEWRLSLFLALALGGWVTDFAHGISPAWISLAAAVACLMPGVGVLKTPDFGKVNFAVVVYVAGILGVGTLIAQSGWGARLGEALIAVAPFDPARPFGNYLTLTGIGFGVGIGTTLPGIPAVMTPFAGGLVDAAQLPLETVLMIQVLSFSTSFFVYQGPPLAVAVQMGWVTLAAATKLLLALASVTILALLPLNYLWWRVLGVI